MRKNTFRLDGKLFTERLRPISVFFLIIPLSGCTSPNMILPNTLEFERSPKLEVSTILGDQKVQRQFEINDTPNLPSIRSSNEKPSQTQAAVEDEKADLLVAFDQMPLPTFIQAVYGPILKSNYSVDGAVAARTDLVTFRTPKPQTRTQMADLTRLLLKSYGIAVQDFGGVIRIVPDTASNSYSPQIRRGRALPDAPISLRPVFNYIELEAVRTSDFASLLRTMFGAKIQLQEDPPRNAVLISGQPDDVAAAMEVIQIFDQPVMRGQRSKRVSPVFWTADEFAKRLVDVLSAEGYVASSTVSVGAPILVMPIAPLNSVIIFSASDTILAHALRWAQDLDRPSDSQAGGAYFTYSVKFADAQALAKTLSELINPGAQAAAPVAGAPAPKRPSRIVVNNNTNSLIIQGGGPDEYRQWMTLLAELDKPTKSALIDVIVAEVTLNDSNSLGFDWTFNGAGTTTGISGVVQTASAGATGLTVNFLNKAGLVKAKLNALATQSNAQILSSPKIMARNGETATIQVGDEVPIITSQQSTAVPGATTGLLSTIQYRTTGVILKVRPVINSGNRIDLDISQEVSNAKITQTGVSISPTISTRKIDTKLSLRDGSTVLLAGLITNDNNLTDSGVPFLKDIPGVGNLFKSSSTTNIKKEMVILITPYVINDDFEAESISAAFQSSLGDWAKELKERSATALLKRPELSAPAPERKEKPELPGINGAPPPLNPAPAIPPSPAQSPIEDLTVQTPEQTVAPASMNKDVNAIPSDVIMSKPEPIVVPPPISPPAATSAVGKKAAPGKTTQGTTRTSPPPVNGRAVENADLLEELRRTVGK